MEQLHQKRSDYSQTLDTQQTAAITDTNKQLEADNQKLEEQLRSLSTNGSDSISYIHPRAPSSGSENGYSGESDGSSSSPAMFNTRVGSNIPVTKNHKADYEKTEKAWFAKACPIKCENLHVIGCMCSQAALFFFCPWHCILMCWPV